MKNVYITLFMSGILTLSCSTTRRTESPGLNGKPVLSVILDNSQPVPYAGVVEVPCDLAIKNMLNKSTNLYALINGVVSPVELSDVDADGRVDVIILETKLGASSKSEAIIFETSGSEGPVFAKKSQAELWHRVTGKIEEGVYVGGGNFYRFDSIRVPDGLMDHAYFIKYEGPGWESDLVGYRFYLDWRNANDVYGKKTRNMVLQDVGVDGYESYHAPADWGMDVLKVGKTLGIGSIAWFDGEKALRVEKTDSVMCKIEADGLLRSQVKTWYYGWQVGASKNSLISLKSIDAGSRMTREVLVFNQPQSMVSTGFIMEKALDAFEVTGSKGTWKALASWGNQSLAGDNLGLAIIYPTSQLGRITKDKINHLVVFEKPLKEVEYYFLAAWEQEPNGIKTLEAFKRYLADEIDRLEHPVVTEVK